MGIYHAIYSSEIYVRPPWINCWFLSTARLFDLYCEVFPPQHYEQGYATQGKLDKKKHFLVDRLAIILANRC